MIQLLNETNQHYDLKNKIHENHDALIFPKVNFLFDFVLR